MTKKHLKAIVTVLMLIMGLFLTHKAQSENIVSPPDTIPCIIVYIDTAIHKFYENGELKAIEYVGGTNIRWCFGYMVFTLYDPDYIFQTGDDGVLYDEFKRPFINKANSRYVLDIYYITEDDNNQY